MKARLITATLLAFWALLAPGALHSEIGGVATVRVGVLKFGTVNWELDVVKHHRLDRAEGFDLEILGLASTLATKTALQAAGADIIVTDWIWVTRQRAEGADFTFVPYSTSLGSLMVPADSGIKTLADLRGKRLGIAGGPLDKSWLLMRALAEKRFGVDLDREVEKVFGAPPLLNQEILSGRIDAVVNFWHFAARLSAAGLRPVISVNGIARALGATTDLPLIGYVFRESWAERVQARVTGFVRATRKAKEILGRSDAEWARIRPLMRAKDEAAFHALRQGYRAGIPKSWGQAERQDAGRIFAILAELGGARLVGKSRVLQPGTFWPGLVF